MSRAARRGPWGPAATAGLLLLSLLAMVALNASWLAPANPFALAGEALLVPSRDHPFGTDDLGRDVYTAVVHGAWSSLLVGVVSAAAATVIGLVIGGFAAIRAGAIDHLLMRFTEFAQAVPRFFLVVVIVSLFGGHLWLVIAAIALTAWPATARIFRAQVLHTLGRDFVMAARASGSSDARILLRHVLPLTAAVIAAQVSYQVGGAILSEAGLSFLGLGDPRVMTWGTLLGAAHQTVNEAWWVALFPGLALTLTVLGCNLLGDALLQRDVGSRR